MKLKRNLFKLKREQFTEKLNWNKNSNFYENKN